MVKQLSIIIPIYNVEDCIEQCILSIVEQAISVSDYELIIINDGSTDRSRILIEKLCQDYSFLNIVDKDNGGGSSARNMGLDMATGNYILFVDADDYLAPNSLEVLLLAINEQNTDILLFDVLTIEPKGHKKAIKHHLPKAYKRISVNDYINEYTILSAPWQGVFKRRLFEDHSIRMPEGRFAEDDDLVVKLYSVAESIYYMPQQVYYYRKRSGSISNTKDKAHNEKLIIDRLEIFKELENYTHLFVGKKRTGLNRKMDYLALDIIRLMIRKSVSEKTINYILNSLLQLNFFPLSNKNYSAKYRLFRFLLSSSPKVFFFANHNFFNRFF